ncbi:MAG: glycosyltransferase family 2 protein [Thermoplasmatota archaeon]
MVVRPLQRFPRFIRYIVRRSVTGYYPLRVRQALQDRRRLRRIRRERPADAPDPLVSVVIATYNRSGLLLERAIPSALRQTHGNLEVVVVGDCCIDDTAQRMANLGNPRVRFLDLPERGAYPTDPRKLWQVAGVVPMNKAVELARGEWIAPLDDDDAFSDDHVAALLEAARAQGAEMAYGVIEMEQPDGTFRPLPSRRLRLGNVTRMALLYRKDIAFIENDLASWKWDEPADWALVRRMRDAGVRIAFVDKVLGKHFADRRGREA